MTVFAEKAEGKTDAFLLHPDLFLCQNPSLREISCFYCATPNGKKHCARFMRLLDGDYVYPEADGFAVLFQKTDEKMAAAENELRRLSLQGAVSGPYERPASARGCLQRAKICLSVGQKTDPDGVLYDYSAYRMRAFEEKAKQVMGEQGFESADFIDARPARMLWADQKNGTEYAHSLRVYLESGMNLRLAAEKMGVHRNTLDYRIRRISDIFSLTLQDNNTCFELLFSCRMAGDEAAILSEFDRADAQCALWDALEGRECTGNMSVRLCVFDTKLLTDEQRLRLLERCLAITETVCAYDEDMIVLCAAGEREEIVSMADMLSHQALCPCAVTQEFGLGRLRARLRLCRAALRIAEESNSKIAMLKMWEAGSFLYFAALERCTSLTPYYCDAVIRVMDYDADKGTNLARALYVYLLCFMDLKRAAEQLGVHRNTMEYQLKRIEAIIGGMPDGQLRFEMMCTYKMLALPDDNAL